MLTPIRIRCGLAAINGVVALATGAMFLVVGSNMSDMFSDIIGAAIVLLISSASLFLAGVSDFIAAYYEGSEHLQRFVFYLMAGGSLLVLSFLLGVYPEASIRWLLIIGAFHALGVAILALTLARRAVHHIVEHYCLLAVGAISITFLVPLIAFTKGSDDGEAAMLLGGYWCFVGVKSLLIAWYWVRRSRITHAGSDKVHLHVIVGRSAQ